MHFSLIESFLVILLIAFIVALVCNQFKLPVILGYLFVGMLVGPYNLGWLPNTDKIKIFSDFGVVLLMFTVGLEFSISKLGTLRRSVFFVGLFQVLFCIIITTWFCLLLKINITAAVIIGSIIAMSSTATVMKQLSDQAEINTHHGANALGILLFQDLAVIPILVFVIAFTDAPQPGFSNAILWALLKGGLSVSLILISGKLFLAPMFEYIDEIGLIEIFTLAVLLVSVGAAWITHILGLSYALGAFIAGMMLAECKQRLKIKAEIRPFRDLLLGLFFISIGMLANMVMWIEYWRWILLFTCALMIAKPLLVIFLSRLARFDLSTSVRTGLLIAQGGEFGFAILLLALKNHLILDAWGQTILAGMLISFFFSSLLIRYNAPLSQYILKRKEK
ncbi:MAG: Potassium efflux system protein [uncultured bacterium]|nr:MAG: Potassium efflux system protein [uncultured bacterium]